MALGCKGMSSHGQNNICIYCHCAQTSLHLWNISSGYVINYKNLHLAATFISLSVRSICFSLYSHFSVLSLSVKWIFPVFLFVLLTLTSFHLLILSFMCSFLSVFVFYFRAALSLIYGYSSAYSVYLGFLVSLHLSLPNLHISLWFQFLHRI